MMTGTFGRNHGSRINWWREAPPVLAVAGLAADYLSPPAMWTMVLPLLPVKSLQNIAYAAVTRSMPRSLCGLGQN